MLSDVSIIENTDIFALRVKCNNSKELKNIVYIYLSNTNKKQLLTFYKIYK